MSVFESNKRAGAARGRSDLGHQYQAIGISAVAAALPYSGTQKNDAYAPARPADQTKRKIVTLADLDHLMV